MAGKRMINSNIIRSESLNSVSGDAEMLWIRLLTVVDDNGNYDSDSLVIFANCVRYKAGATQERVTGWLKELEKSDLISFYKFEGTKYLHFNNFHKHQHLRTDIRVDKTWPVHPETVESKAIVDETRRIVVDRESDEPVTQQERTRNERVADAEQVRTVKEEEKEEVEVKEKEEEEAASTTHFEDPENPTPPNFRNYQREFKHHAGRKAKDFPKDIERYESLCNKYTEDSVLKGVPVFVENKGGKARVRKNEWASKNYLHDEAEDILDSLVDEQNESPKFHAPTKPDPAKWGHLGNL